MILAVLFTARLTHLFCTETKEKGCPVTKACTTALLLDKKPNAVFYIEINEIARYGLPDNGASHATEKVTFLLVTKTRLC